MNAENSIFRQLHKLRLVRLDAREGSIVEIPVIKEGHNAQYIDLPDDEVGNEITYLKTHIFTREIRGLPKDRFSSKLRYSKRF
jgi:hypothetical protein